MTDVSIFIPAYNAARFLPEALASTLRQDLPSFEVVVVDDASTDGTQRACESFMSRHPDAPVRFHRNVANVGSGANRNACVRRCKGEYLINLDADDMLPDGMVARLVTAARRTREATGEHRLAHPQQARFFLDSNRRTRLMIPVPWKRRLHVDTWEWTDVDPEHVLTHPRSPATSVTQIIHREILETTGGFFEDCGAYDTWSFGVRCQLAGFGFEIVPDTFYWHRLHKGSLWMQDERSQENRAALYRAIQHFPDVFADSTFEALDPENPEYPEGKPLDPLELRDPAAAQRARVNRYSPQA